MRHLFYLSHPQVDIKPEQPVPEWSLSNQGWARVMALAARRWPKAPCHIFSSPETKARQTAAILANPLGVPVNILPRSSEFDRSSTGYLPHDEHEAQADLLFAAPTESANGWERAVDAQSRMLGSLAQIQRTHPAGDLLMVGHGGVGTVLWCAISGQRIQRSQDQQAGGGCIWSATLTVTGPKPLQPWAPMEQYSA
ncbi:MAG: histidine phosphatase family protein [Paracoccaceae bacterium]